MIKEIKVFEVLCDQCGKSEVVFVASLLQLPMGWAFSVDDTGKRCILCRTCLEKYHEQKTENKI